MLDKSFQICKTDKHSRQGNSKETVFSLFWGGAELARTKRPVWKGGMDLRIFQWVLRGCSKSEPVAQDLLVNSASSMANKKN